MSTTDTNETLDLIYAVVIATRSRTWFVSHHRSRDGAEAFAERANEHVKRGAKHTVIRIRLEP